MPRGDRRSQSSQNASQSRRRSDLNESEVTFSQASQSQAGRAALSPEDETRYGALVARYAMAVHGRGAAITHADIRKHVLSPLPRGALGQVLLKAADILQHTFGLRMYEMAEKREILLANMLETKDHVKLSEEEQQRRGLLMVVLALIFMNHEPVKEELLWQFLKRLGIDCDHPHECFGDVKKLITQEFVRQHYLKLKKVDVGAKQVVEFHWGERAELEVRKLDMLQFVSKMWGDSMTPEKWSEQYQRATAEIGDDEND